MVSGEKLGKMLTLDQLKEWLEDVRNIVIDLNISIQNAERLTENKYEFEEQIKQHGFFQHHWYQLRFISVLQICKLLCDGKNEKRSFIRLCNRLEELNYDQNLSDLLAEPSRISTYLVKSQDDVLNLTSWIKAEICKHKGLINQVKSARNQIYAHSDPGAAVSKIKVSEIRELVDLSSSIYNNISFKFLFTRTWLDNLDDWSIDYVLSHMNESRIRHEEIKNSLIR